MKTKKSWRRFFFAQSALLLIWTCSTPQVILYRPRETVVEFYKTNPPLQINVYPGPRKAVGAVIMIHGGGWMMGGPDIPLYQDWESRFNDADLRVFSIEHRLAPGARGRDQVEDCVDAVHFIQANAQKYGFPADKISLMGFSSGGHLAVMTGLILSRRPLRRPSPIRSVISFYAPLDPAWLLTHGDDNVKHLLLQYLPPVDFPEGTEEDQKENFLRRALMDISPIDNLHLYAPPLFIIHGESDSLIPYTQGSVFAQRAMELGLKNVVFLPVPGAEHNFNASRNRRIREVEQKAIDFAAQSMR